MGTWWVSTALRPGKLLYIKGISNKKHPKLSTVMGVFTHTRFGAGRMPTPQDG